MGTPRTPPRWGRTSVGNRANERRDRANERRSAATCEMVRVLFARFRTPLPRAPLPLARSSGNETRSADHEAPSSENEARSEDSQRHARSRTRARFQRIDEGHLAHRRTERSLRRIRSRPSEQGSYLPGSSCSSGGQGTPLVGLTTLATPHPFDSGRCSRAESARPRLTPEELWNHLVEEAGEDPMQPTTRASKGRRARAGSSRRRLRREGRTPAGERLDRVSPGEDAPAKRRARPHGPGGHGSGPPGRRSPTSRRAVRIAMALASLAVRGGALSAWLRGPKHHDMHAPNLAKSAGSGADPPARRAGVGGCGWHAEHRAGGSAPLPVRA